MATDASIAEPHAKKRGGVSRPNTRNIRRASFLILLIRDRRPSLAGMNLFRSPWLWVALVVLVCVSVVILVARGRRKGWGFKDALENPRQFMAEMAFADEEYERALAEARTWDTQAVAAKVRWFVLEIPTERDAGSAKRILASLGEKTHRAVIELLSDVSLHDRLITPTGENPLPEAPFNRACDLLAKRPPRAAIAVVAPFLDGSSNEVKKSAALVVGQTGNLDAVPYIRKAFGDPDEYVRSYAIIGINRAREDGVLDAGFESALVPALMALVAAGKNVDDAAPLLLRFAPDRAPDFLLSDQIFRSDSRSLHEVVRAMNAAQVAIPRAMLLGLVSTLGRDGDALKYPQTYLLGETLLALGRHREPEDVSLLEKMLSHSEERVAEGAAAGLTCVHGLDGFEDRIWSTEGDSRASLSIPQRRFSAVHMCDAEIRNGGISQYFFNSSGDQWKDALAGFEAMGCVERASILRDAIRPFGPSGPSEDRDIRTEQLSRLHKKNGELFDALETRYYASKEVIAVGAVRYVIQNPEAFR